MRVHIGYVEPGKKDKIVKYNVTSDINVYNHNNKVSPYNIRPFYYTENDEEHTANSLGHFYECNKVLLRDINNNGSTSVVFQNNRNKCEIDKIKRKPSPLIGWNMNGHIINIVDADIEIGTLYLDIIGELTVSDDMLAIIRCDGPTIGYVDEDNFIDTMSNNPGRPFEMFLAGKLLGQL